MIDALGNELQVGDIVIFFRRRGTQVGSQYSLILEFTANNEIAIISADKWRNGTFKVNKQTGLSTNPGCMVKIEKPSLLMELLNVFSEWIEGELRE